MGYEGVDSGQVETEHREDSLQSVDQTAQIGAVDGVEVIR